MVDAAKFQAVCEILDTRFPGLSSFADPRFEREEIIYKKRAIEAAQERLSRSALTELLHRKDYEGFSKALEEVGKKRISSTSPSRQPGILACCTNRT